MSVDTHLMFAWVSFSENVRNRGKAIFKDFDVVTYVINVPKIVHWHSLRGDDVETPLNRQIMK